MFKKQIYIKGLYKAPEELEVKILLQAVEKMNLSEETDDSWLNYVNWIPFLGVFVLLKDLLTCKKLTIRPILTI